MSLNQSLSPREAAGASNNILGVTCLTGKGGVVKTHTLSSHEVPATSEPILMGCCSHRQPFRGAPRCSRPWGRWYSCPPTTSPEATGSGNPTPNGSH